MRVLAIVPALAFAGVALAAATATPAAAIETINCHEDLGRAERTICSSQKLQILDAQVTEAYADIMLDRRIGARVKRNVYDSQLEFLRRRDACGSDTECLTEVMERRVSRIRFYL